MNEIIYILIALVLAFIAFKVLMGLLRVGVILMIVIGLAVAYSQGSFG